MKFGIENKNNFWLCLDKMRALNSSVACTVTAATAGERIFQRGIVQGQDFFWPPLYVWYLQFGHYVMT